jgi:molybdenum cofactor biosynthesis enzyme MoaA
LDTLNADRFFSITGRDEFANVMATLNELLKNDIEVKINAVVMDGKNTQDIIPLVELTKQLPVSVRFIEEMPFNGDGHIYNGLKWNYVRILEEIQSHYPQLEKLTDPMYSTSCNYRVAGHKGSVGVIAAYSRTFCGTCNRIRITPVGELKTCLYDGGILNIKNLMRNGDNEEQLKNIMLNTFNNRAKNGWEAESLRPVNNNVHESMATIGG